MANINFDEIKVINNELSELDILRNLIDKKNGEEPIHLLNVGDIIQKHHLWIQKMPRVVPYYAVKCNPNLTIIKVLAALGGHFDCASKQEIMQVMSQGVSGDKIIYANPIKFPSYIEFAKKVGVDMMTADSENELIKIKQIYPKAKIVLRIRCDTTVTTSCLGKKFGCDPSAEATSLVKTIVELGLTLYGFSFHTGSPCGEPTAICRGITWCNNLIDTAKAMGCHSIKLIDIGGGIPGERDFRLDQFSEPINNALKNVDSSVQIISEIGRYYVTSAVISAAYIFGKKTSIISNKKNFMYYVSDGVYGSFIEELLHIKTRHPISLSNTYASNNNEKYLSTIWGPTCDAYDCILKNEMLSEFQIGDWLVWLNMGSYSTCRSNEFNGFQPPKIYPIIRKNDWDTFLIEINNKKQKREQE